MSSEFPAQDKIMCLSRYRYTTGENMLAMFCPGLCGTFNVNSDDDFTLPNGTALNITDERDVQPDEFIQAWR